MLSDATLVVAARADLTTLVARSTSSLRALAGRISVAGAEALSLRLDWSDRRAFLNQVEAHGQKHGWPDLVLAWLHDDLLAPELAIALCRNSDFCRFIHVRSSVTQDPVRDEDQIPARFEAMPRVAYQQLILGFVVGQEGSRWLTHAEISQAAVRAIDNPELARTVAGVISPWSMRP